MVSKKVLPTDYTTAEVTATDLVPMMESQMVTLTDWNLEATKVGVMGNCLVVVIALLMALLME